VELHRRRIYILPTRLGVVFAVMVGAMLLGSLNYGNNLGLALTFMLAALGLVAMHRCHHNLLGLRLQFAGGEPCFAGEPARFTVGLANPSRAPRYDLQLATDQGAAAPMSLDGGETAFATLELPTVRRGRIALTRFKVATHYPFALFHAWAVLHPDWSCIVFPRPARDIPAPPAVPLGESGTAAGHGDEDFAGLKDYRPGDSPKHVAWKALARSGEMLVKEFAGEAATVRMFDLERTPGTDIESRLAVLARWIVDADAAGHRYGLVLGAQRHEPATGAAQRDRCLTALADFPADTRP
jgi:uncharacterized protein (DUF58 family)